MIVENEINLHGGGGGGGRGGGFANKTDNRTVFDKHRKKRF